MLAAVRVTFLALTTVLLSAPPARADVVRVPADAPTVQSALDAAAPGDVVLVTPGHYPEAALMLGKGVSLVADGAEFSLNALDVREVPAGQFALVRGLKVHAPSFPAPGRPAVFVRTNAGSVRFEDCVFRGHTGVALYFDGGIVKGYAGTQGALVANSVDVAFHDCHLRGGFGANVIDSSFQIGSSSGGTGLETSASAVVVSDCLLEGGVGGHDQELSGAPGGNGGSGLMNREGAQVDVHGSELRGGPGGAGSCDLFAGGCVSGADGGDGLRQVNVASGVVLRDSLTVGGAAGPGGSGFGPGSPGSPTSIFNGTQSDYVAAHRSLRSSSPTREGESLSLEIVAEAGDGLLLFGSFGGAYAPLPLRQGVFLLGFPLLLPGTFLGVAPSAAPLVVDVPIPELGPGVEGFVLPLQLAITAGGEALLGPATTAVLLDGGL